MTEIKDYFIDRVNEIDGVKVNSAKGSEGAPHIASVSFEGIRSEVLLHSLEDKNIYVSAGSACSSNKKSVSSTLKSMGIEEKYLDSTVRFSFSSYSTKEEVDYTIETIKSLAAMLRLYKHS